MDRPQTLTAADLHHAYLTPFLHQAAETLEQKLHDTQALNADMMHGIQAQQAEIQLLVSGLEGIVEDIEGSLQAMGSDGSSGVKGLRAEVWALDQEVEDTR